MNQNVMGRSKDGTRHAEREFDVQARLQFAIELEQNPTGRDVAGMRFEFGFAG